MNKDRILLSSIYFLFHAGLMAYKLFHPLWFYEQGKLEYFAVGYAFMALGGILSRTYFLFFADVMRISFLLSLSGVMLSVGICVSCIPFHIGYSIIGGLISGFGATTFMSILYRITHMKESKESIIVDVPQVINYSQFIGTLGATTAAYFISTLNSNNLTGILVSSFLALISWMPLLFFKIKHEVYDDIEMLHRDPLSLQKVKQMYKQKPYLVRAIVTRSILGGMFINMSLPFFPIVLKKCNLDLFSVGLFISISYVFSSLAHKFIHNFFHKKFHVKGFALTGIFFMLISIGIGYFQNPWITGGLVVLHCFIYGGYGLWRKSIEYEILPRDKMPDYMNLGGMLYQSSIVISTLLATYIITNYGFNINFYTSSLIALLNSFLTLFFVYKNLEQEVNEYLKNNNIKNKQE